MSAKTVTEGLRTSERIRSEFIDFFVKEKAHTFWPSSPVVPHDDPTLLFANAGMNQFKPIFLGKASPDTPLGRLRRAANSQKCIRAGGKHNDLEDVGRDTYHHTFFEMLGNWSFGDYFKREAIDWAWELLVERWGLDPDRLCATYFQGDADLGLEPDEEAKALWLEKLPAERVLAFGAKDNFWEMGETGPCGPCSEIHYDSRPEQERRSVPAAQLVNRDHPDVIEIWNLVFIQFDRQQDGLTPLPARHVDTGMGLERITRVLQGKRSNYDTDLFAPLFARIEEVCRCGPYTGSLEKREDVAYRVVADHARALTFAITDGAEPSNEGRGYVLRRILRRAHRHGRQTLGAEGPFLCELVPTIVEKMGGAFPELRDNPQRVADVIRAEEEAFGRTLERGLALFDEAAGRASDGVVQAQDAFKLHDTYGFPLDLTCVMAQERGLSVDVAGFERLMEQARQTARAAGAGKDSDAVATLPPKAVAALEQLGVTPTDDKDKYDPDLKPVRAQVKAIWNGRDFDEAVDGSSLRPGDRVAVVLNRTNFYAEAGGQVGDAGRLLVVSEARTSARDAHEGGELKVEDAQSAGGFVLHIGRLVRGEIRVGDVVEARVDRARRRGAMANHTATHLLNFALREVLGEKVEQKGSLVAPDRLRFDFSHDAPLTDEELARVEAIVRERVEADAQVFTGMAPLEQARRINGVRAVFGETYPDPVRVVCVGAPVEQLLAEPDSPLWRTLPIEFCGGTHLRRAGEALAFTIVAEEAVARGVRRVEALTGKAAQEAIEAGRRAVALAQRALETADAAVIEQAAAFLQERTTPLLDRRRAQRLLDEAREKRKVQDKAQARDLRARAVEQARRIAEEAQGPVVVARVEAGGDRQALLAALDAVMAKKPDGAVLLFSADASSGKVAIVARAAAALVERGLNAGQWVRAAAGVVGGKGGGKPEAAQGGGDNPAKIDEAVALALRHAQEALG